MIKERPIVSICCITYNHAKFIKECLDGFEKQQVDFPLEIIIHDDLSTDNTRELLLTYKESSKFHVKLLFPDYNRYSKGERIFPQTFREAKGKYIAMCEGDDYWTDPLKLQLQVDFLEANKDYVIHSGNAINYIEHKKEFRELELKEKTFEIKDFYIQNNLITTTVMFRVSSLPIIPQEYFKCFYGDWFLYVILLNKVKAKAFRSKEVLSVYRIHAKGTMSINNGESKHLEFFVNQIFLLKKYLKLTKYDYSKSEKKIIDSKLKSLVIVLINRKKLLMGLGLFVWHIRINGFICILDYLSYYKKRMIKKYF